MLQDYDLLYVGQLREFFYIFFSLFNQKPHGSKKNEERHDETAWHLTLTECCALACELCFVNWNINLLLVSSSSGYAANIPKVQ